MSNINPYNIDGTYPVAGQDNDSQGFRDNFTNIRNNFSYAESEVSDLQAKALTTSALIGGTLTNNMSYNQIQYAQLFSPSYTFNNQGSLAGAVLIDYSQGSVQQVTPIGSITLSFANWPTSGQYGSVQVWLTITNVNYTVTVPSSVTIGLSDIAGANTSTNVITFDAPDSYILEFSSTNAGSNIFIKDRTRNKSTMRDPNFYWNTAVSNTFFIGFGPAIQTAIAAEMNRDVISTLGSHNSTSIGNLSLGNISNGVLDTGDLAGYNITSARGNLQLGSITPAQPNDLLGYFNAVTYTGNTTANAFNQIGRIDFHATGSNVVTGLGGNIAMYTAQAGNGASQYTVNQAIGIENDQSLHVFGNLTLGQLGSTNANSSYVPAHNNSTGNVGQIAWSTSSGTSYFYVCVAANTWNRVQLNSTSW